ncbi:hypothetical protein UP74_22615, partial [Escherichia coli]
RTDVSADGPDGVLPPGEGLISGALPLMKAEVRPAAFRIAVASPLSVCVSAFPQGLTATPP